MSGSRNRHGRLKSSGRPGVDPLYALDAPANKDFHYVTNTYFSRKLKEKGELA